MPPTTPPPTDATPSPRPAPPRGEGRDELRISVVIPTVGADRLDLLGRVLVNLERSQGPRERLEVVVVVDGGDGTDLGLHELGSGLDLQVLGQPRSGPAVARNRGWRASTGDVVAFLDDDAGPGHRWLADLRAAFAADPDLAGLGGAVEPLRPRNLVSRTLTDQGHLAHTDGPWGARLITANAAFRRSALEAVGGFDERLAIAAGEDWDLCDRLGRAGFVVRRTDRAVVHHRHPTTVAQMLATCRRYRAGTAELAALAEERGPGSAAPGVAGAEGGGGAGDRSAGGGRARGLARRVGRDVELVAGAVRRRRAGLPAVEEGEEPLRQRAVARFTVPVALASTRWAAGRGAGGANVERAGWALVHVVHGRYAYRQARQRGTPWPTSLGEVGLELLWRAEFSRPGAAPT